MEQSEQERQAEDLEQEAKYTIISMDDDEKSDKKKILDDARDELTRLFCEFREWLSDNIHSEEVGERFERLKQETTNLMKRTKVNIQTFNEREDVIVGKEKAKEFGNKIVNTFNDGIQDMMHHETVSKVVDGVSDTFDNITHDERLVKGVKKFKKGTLKLAESAFDGLKRVLDTDDDHEDDQKG